MASDREESVRISRGNVEDRITTEISVRCAEEISRALRYRSPDYRFTPKFKKSRWDGWNRLYSRKKRTYPAGLRETVSKILYKYYRTIYVDTSPILTAGGAHIPPPNGIEFRPYQYEALQHVLDNNPRTTLQVATGGGKTVIAAMIMSAIGTKVVFLVHTKDLLYQALQMFREMLGENTVGQVGDGICQTDRAITVCTVQTACRYRNIKWESESAADAKWLDKDTDISRLGDLLDGVGMIIVDECHRTAAPSILKLLKSMPLASYRIGLSASPWRDDGADMAIYGALGPVGFSLSASELFLQDYLVQPYIRFLDVPHMHFSNLTNYQGVYNGYIARNEVRNRMGIRAAAKMVKRGLPTLVLIRLISHGEAISADLSDHLGFDVPFIHGSKGNKIRASTIEDMRQGDIPIMVASTIADEGLDIKPLAGLVLLGGGKSSTKALQRVGRVLRTFPGKEHAEVIDFNDRCRFLDRHSAARLKMYNSEPEWEILDV